MNALVDQHLQPQKITGRFRHLASAINEKIIVHLHNGHAAKNIDKLKGYIPDVFIKESLNVGSRLNKKYGTDCFYIGTSYYSGTYCKWDYKAKEIPTPTSDAIETKLHNQGYKYALLPLKDNTLYTMYHNEFNSWVEGGVITAPFGQLYDALLFINHVKIPIEKPVIDKGK